MKSKLVCFLFVMLLLLGMGSFVMPGSIVSASEVQPDKTADGEQVSDMGQEKDGIVVVIDPGHGGENLGGEFEDYTEKDMTFTVAMAMKEELEQYEGVTVYLTRTKDQELTLDERCAYAESVNADFMFCLHFNLSQHHTLFGAECWISAFGENYSKGYSFASVEMELLEELGLYSRGIKTRLNDAGVDYYGIIRHSTERNIPCVLIEHCHMDQENDQPFYDHDQKLKDFGKLDATAVAKYFNLHSGKLGIDYSAYQNVSVEVPSYVVAPDKTEPDVCMIDVVGQNMENGEVTVQVSAADYDSGMLYYAYSYDNGEHFSGLLKWPDKTKDTFQFTMQVPPRILPQIVVNAYNGYDLYTASNMVSLPTMDYKTEEEIAAELTTRKALESISRATPSKPGVSNKDDIIMTEREKPVKETDDEPVSFTYFLAVCGVCALLVLGMVFSMGLIIHGSRKRQRRRRRNMRRH